VGGGVKINRIIRGSKGVEKVEREKKMLGGCSPPIAAKRVIWESPLKRAGRVTFFDS